jgi:hypothetical protein
MHVTWETILVAAKSTMALGCFYAAYRKTHFFFLLSLYHPNNRLEAIFIL